MAPNDAHKGETGTLTERDPMLDSFDACEVCEERHPPGECDGGAPRSVLAHAGDRLFYEPDECSVGGVNWPLCALRIAEHPKCRARRTEHQEGR